MKILFINHEATKTGAPKVLLLLLRYLKKHAAFDFEILSIKGGNMIRNFESITQTMVLEKPGTKNLIEKSLKYVGLRSSMNGLKPFIKEKYQLIYANSIMSLKVAMELKERLPIKPKLILHVHELKTVIDINIPDFISFVPDIDYFIAASQLVKTSLIEDFNIPAEKISVVYEFSEIDSHFEQKVERKYLQVGSSGTVHWRKGHDLFIQVAIYLQSNYPEEDIRFEWIGNVPFKEGIILNQDIKKAKLQNIVFTGQLDNPSEKYRTFDLFIMTSREDPFPLVCIEVGMLGVPIICFEGATGTQEIIEKGGGFIVPYLNVGEMAEKILMYHRNRELLKSDSVKVRDLFSEFSPDKLCNQIYEIITSNLNLL